MMIFAKKLLFICLLGSIFWAPNIVLSNEQSFSGYQDVSFVTPVFPIRGEEFWPLPGQTPYENFKKQYELIKSYNLAASWLFRYDALKIDQIFTTVRLFPSNQESGLFLEITPGLANDAQVTYQRSDGWSDPKAVFLSGYTLAERERLINTAMGQFLKLFGYVPKSVGAWHIDAWSANYMYEKYRIAVVMIVSDQYATDRYQMWGGWWGVPYYPSKFNILSPAQTTKNKLPVTVVHWAIRDPVNGYGGDVSASTYSVQANDYLMHGLDSSYFNKLLDIYTGSSENEFGYLLTGIENDYDWKLYGDEINNQLSIISEKVGLNKFEVTTLSEFANWYQETYSEISPNHTISATDPLESKRTVKWEMTTRHRLGYEVQTDKNTIIDYRIYNENFAEPFLETRNQFSKLHVDLPAVVDTVTSPEQSNVEINKVERFNLPYEKNSEAVYVWYATLVLLVVWILRRSFLLAGLILLGSTTISLPMIKSGWLYPFGMGFWGPNGHDGIWHLSMIEHFSQNWNLNNPIMAGEKLYNYHFLFDLILAVINRSIPFVDSLTLYFQIIPPLLAILLGMTTYFFMWQWSKSKLATYLAVLLVYFGGGWGWAVTWWREGSLGGESMFWSTQAISTLINPPFVLSMILLLVGVSLMKIYEKNLSFSLGAVLVILFGSLIHAKVYAALLFFTALSVIVLVEIVKYKFYFNKLKWFWIWTTGLTMSAISILPITKIDSSLWQFEPLWFPHTMLEFSDRLYWPRLSQAIQAYWATGNWTKWLAAESLAVGLFLAGNLGIRIIGVGGILKTAWQIRRIKIDSLSLMLFTMTLLAFAIPLLFTQKGTPWNTIQFMYYGLFFMNLFTAKVIGEWLDKKISKRFILLIFAGIFLVNLPTTIGTLKHYLPYRAPSRVPYEELSALNFLQQQPDGIVLTYPFSESEAAKYDVPKPLARYVSTAYVSALSAHPVYLEDEVNLEILGYDWRPRREAVTRFFYTLNLDNAKKFMSDNQIQYLYLLKGETLNVNMSELGTKKIFDNGLVEIYRKV